MQLFKKIFSFFVLFSFLFIGFFHNSMMAFAMQTKVAKQMMQKMNCDHSSKDCQEKCHNSDLKIKNTSFLNNYFSKKIIKIKFFSFIDIFSKQSKFLENKNLIKNTSTPFLNKEIKFYFYSDLVKIIKSNT